MSVRPLYRFSSSVYATCGGKLKAVNIMHEGVTMRCNQIAIPRQFRHRDFPMPAVFVSRPMMFRVKLEEFGGRKSDI